MLESIVVKALKEEYSGLEAQAKIRNKNYGKHPYIPIINTFNLLSIVIIFTFLFEAFEVLATWMIISLFYKNYCLKRSLKV